MIFNTKFTFLYYFEVIKWNDQVWQFRAKSAVLSDEGAYVKSLVVMEKFGSAVVDARIGYIRNVVEKTLPKISYVIFAFISTTLGLI